MQTKNRYKYKYAEIELQMTIPDSQFPIIESKQLKKKINDNNIVNKRSIYT